MKNPKVRNYAKVICLNKTIIFILIFILGAGIAVAQLDQYAETKKLIDSKLDCSKLSEKQLESIGDYYMEQLHPGTAHKAMEQMMGGEGSESLRLMHIAMARRLYCNDYSGSANYGIMSGGMMNMMMGKGVVGNNMMGYGMMDNYGYSYWSFISLLYAIFLIGLIVLVYLWIIKLWKDVFHHKK